MTKNDIFYQEVRNQVKNYYRYNKEPNIQLIYQLAADARIPHYRIEEVIQDTMADMRKIYATAN